MQHITDNELTMIIEQRVKQAADELYQGSNQTLRNIAKVGAITYTKEVLAEILTDIESK